MALISLLRGNYDQLFRFFNKKNITSNNTAPDRMYIQTGVSLSLYGWKVTEIAFPPPISERLYRQVSAFPET